MIVENYTRLMVQVCDLDLKCKEVSNFVQCKAYILQEDSYYPFGMAMHGLNHLDDILVSNNTKNKYLYNGKEIQEELDLGLYDYGFRFYDQILGRFHSQDPLSDFLPRISAYSYAFNDPINYIDHLGLWPKDKKERMADRERRKRERENRRRFRNQKCPNGRSHVKHRTGKNRGGGGSRPSNSNHDESRPTSNLEYIAPMPFYGFDNNVEELKPDIAQIVNVPTSFPKEPVNRKIQRERAGRNETKEESVQEIKKPEKVRYTQEEKRIIRDILDHINKTTKRVIIHSDPTSDGVLARYFDLNLIRYNTMNIDKSKILGFFKKLKIAKFIKFEGSSEPYPERD